MRALPRSEQPDDELTRWLAEGYAPAFRTAVVLLGNRADAEEAVQDAFLRAWRFRAAVPDGEGVKPWLYRVVVNAALSKRRADARRPSRTTSLEAEAVPPDTAPAIEGPEGATLAREQRRIVFDALSGLPEHLRVVVVLRYYAQLSEKEIATVIHRRPGTVKSRLHQARMLLGADERVLALDPRPGGPQAYEGPDPVQRGSIEAFALRDTLLRRGGDTR